MSEEKKIAAKLKELRKKRELSKPEMAPPLSLQKPIQSGLQKKEDEHEKRD